MDSAITDESGYELADRIWRAGVDAVRGDAAVDRALEADPGMPRDAVLAVGKAASAMVSGALSHLPGDCRVLLITKYDHVDASLRGDERITIIESGHPMPDTNSLAAGQAAIDFVAGCAAESGLLVLVSGGASALVEALVPGVGLDTLRRLSTTLLADGYSIDQINHIRIAISRVKGGRLLRRFRGREIRVLGISDIPGDDAALIGSGIGAVDPPTVEPFRIPDWIRDLMATAEAAAIDSPRAPAEFRFRTTLVGSNALAREAAAAAAAASGLPLIESIELLNDDIHRLAPRLARRLRDGAPGIYLWGGEPTVQLPPEPGEGGRNQSLALALTLELGVQDDIRGIIAGTDGTDGPTTAAGGLVGSALDDAAARRALEGADAGRWLRDHDRRYVTGPTGTNVMDLAVLIRGG